MTPFCCAKLRLKCVKLASMQHCLCSTVIMTESKSKKPKACTKFPRIFIFGLSPRLLPGSFVFSCVWL